MSPDDVLSLIGLATAAWVFTRILKSPIAEALARRIGGNRVSESAHDGEVAELSARVSELEERLDFTERVLLQERQAGQLRQGGAT